MSIQFNPGPPRRTMGTSGVFAVADLSPSINPAILGQVEPRDKVRSLGVAALAALREQGLAALHIARAIHDDQTIGEAERHRRAAQKSAELVRAAMPPVERALGANEKAISELQTMLAGPTTELSDVQAVEIRSKLSGLPADKRFGAISRSIVRGEDTVAKACLGSDRILTDFLGDAELDAIRGLWRLHRHPDAVARLKVLEGDRAHLERGAAVMRSWQRQTHNPAIAAALPAGGTQQRGAPGPAPMDRSRQTGMAGIAARARGMV